MGFEKKVSFFIVTDMLSVKVTLAPTFPDARLCWITAIVDISSYPSKLLSLFCISLPGKYNDALDFRIKEITIFKIPECVDELKTAELPELYFLLTPMKI